MVYIPGLFSKDLFRFGTFVAVSGGSYKIVTKLLQKWLRERGKVCIYHVCNYVYLCTYVTVYRNSGKFRTIKIFV